jgi:nucleoid DNA-binding protein
MTTTSEIADKIATEQSLTRTQAKAIVESVFSQISEAARSGAETSIPGFGKFKVKDTGARGSQPVDRRDDQDRGLEEAVLHAGESRQGRAQRLTAVVNPSRG